MRSKHFGSKQIAGVNKLGDAMFPGGEGFPSFSVSGCARDLDRILDFMPAQDIRDLGMLLWLIASFPRPFARVFIWLLEKSSALPGPFGALLRTIRLGVRGLVMSLYYADREILERLEYQVKVHTDDIKPGV